MTSHADLSVAMTVEQLWQPAPGGSGTYIAELAHALVDRPGLDVSGLAARSSAPPALPLPVSMPVRHSPLPRAALYELWSRRRSRSTDAVQESLRDGRVLHATTWAIPPRTAPLVVTVHDVAFLRAPEHFTTRGNAFFRRALQIVVAEADLVVVPSTTTATDCAAAGIDEDRLRVIHHGVRTEPVDPAGLDEFRDEHGLGRPYLLWCGTVEPRKNVAGLLRAYAELIERDDPGLDLVLVGPHGWGASSAEVTALVDRLPHGRVHLLGRLDPAQLGLAYAGARVFCFPSFWEGFGMPVLEAMAHGVPVVTSQGTSMAEVSPRGALLVDPTRPTQIADALRRAAGPEHERLAAEALTNAAGFDWRRSAEQHVAVYREALDRAAPG